MTWFLVMVFEISVVMAFGFVLGRVWPLHDVRSVWMADCELEMGNFTPSIGRIPTSCATTTGERLYYPRPCLEQKDTVALLEIEAAGRRSSGRGAPARAVPNPSWNEVLG